MTVMVMFVMLMAGTALVMVMVMIVVIVAGALLFMLMVMVMVVMVVVLAFMGIDTPLAVLPRDSRGHALQPVLQRLQLQNLLFGKRKQFKWTDSGFSSAEKY